MAHAIPEPQEAVTQHRISDRDKHFRDDAERKMDLLKDFALLTRVRHREVVVEGRPEEALARLVDTEHVDLLVLGTHGRTGVPDLLLGSVAEAIFRTMKCPMVTVGPRVRFVHEDPARIDRVLFVTDLASTQHALPYAVFIARDNKAKLMMLHVLEGTSVLPYDVPDRWAEETKQQMRELFATGSGLEDQPEILVEMGRPAREILATALVHTQTSSSWDCIPASTRAHTRPGPWHTRSYPVPLLQFLRSDPNDRFCRPPKGEPCSNSLHVCSAHSRTPWFWDPLQTAVNAVS